MAAGEQSIQDSGTKEEATMVKRITEAGGSGFGFKATGAITAEDVKAIEPEIEREIARSHKRPIGILVDLTELKGTYTFDLSWTPDDSEKAGGKLGMAMTMIGGGPPAAASAGGPPASDATSEPGPSLAQALLTNYGLRIEPKKNPADILVIDHAERVPTEN